jgi:hypothetical protein
LAAAVAAAACQRQRGVALRMLRHCTASMVPAAMASTHAKHQAPTLKPLNLVSTSGSGIRSRASWARFTTASCDAKPWGSSQGLTCCSCVRQGDAGVQWSGTAQ